jgi:hypothetical protein
MTKPDEEDDSEYNLAPLDDGSAAHTPERQITAGQVRLQGNVAKKPASKPSSLVFHLVGVVGGGVIGLALGTLALAFVFKIDPLGLNPPRKPAENAPAPANSPSIPGPPPAP